MEENETILLSQCRSRISTTGKWINLFSIFAAISMALMVVAGILLLNFASQLDDNVPQSLGLFASISGIALILAAAGLIAPLMLLRQAYHASREVRANMDVYPMLEALKVTHKFWKYMTWFIFICLCLSILAAFIAFLYILPRF